MSALKIIDLSYFIGEKQILKSVNLQLPETGITYFTGPNGGGKSTLLKLIAGLLKPMSGEIVRKDSSIALMSALSHFGTELPISALGLLELYGIKYSTNQKIKKLVEQWNLNKILEQQISQLSSGELQKIILCAHLSRDKKVLLLDEPLSHIAPESSRVIWNSIHDYSKNALVVMVTHQTQLIQEFYGPEYCVHQILHLNSSQTSKSK